MMQNGREQRIPEQDMIDAKFALAAFLCAQHGRDLAGASPAERRPS
jgi:hypothetical protein